MKKEIICTVCPMGCHLQVEGSSEEITSVTGNSCDRGKEYGAREFLHPERILTSTVKLEGEDCLIPVRSNKPIPKECIMDCMKIIRETNAKRPVNTYDVIIPNICNCGVDIVATDSIK